MKLEDLPPRYREQARAQLSGARLSCVGDGRPAQQTLPPPERKENTRKTKTEVEFEQTYLRGRNAIFEGLTFKLRGGARYTPDFVYCDQSDGHIVCVEVKGSYALHSENRARVAFLEARALYPCIEFRWFKKVNHTWQERNPAAN